ncbi:MAG: serine/threonine-protein kinase, partial [Candidatus Eremiobacterota bacterium]
MRALLLVLALTLPATGQEPAWTLKVRTYPMAARVKLDGFQDARQRGDVVTVDLSALRGPLRIRLDATGYRPMQVEVPAADLQAPGHYTLPPQGSPPWTLAEDPPIQAIFRASPAGAQVFYEGDPLGPANEPIPLPASILKPQGKGSFQFTLELPHYAPETVQVLGDWDALSLQATRQGQLTMPMEGGSYHFTRPDVPGLVPLYYAARNHPYGAAATGAAVLVAATAAAVLLRRRGKELKRLRRLQELVVPTDDDSIVGRVLGSCQIVSLLGRGGMARVYRALPRDTLDPSDQRAVKLLNRDDFDPNSDLAQRFKREVNLMSRLRHPNIVRLDEFSLEEGLNYLVMELVDGVTLREKMPEGEPLPPAQVVAYLRQIGDALQYAHDNQIVHRDLKPENLMVTREGLVKV